MSEKVTNVRKAKCADCKRVLEPGTGIRREMPWFQGHNPYFYLCESCDGKRKMDAEEKAAGLSYE